MAASIAVWIFSAVVLTTLQFLVVALTSVTIFWEMLAVTCLGSVRYSLRFITWPWRWRRKQQLYRAVLRIRRAPTHDEWLAAATELDEEDGGTLWRATAESDEYDYALIAETVGVLRQARRSGDIFALLFLLSSIMDRHFAGMDTKSLYRHARTGTKILIEEFIKEVEKSLDAVAESDALQKDAKLDFFESCRLSLGRTALCLSGGGALALAHSGVVRTLISHGLLPRVISGTSGGSILVALMALNTDEELMREVLTPSIIRRGGGVVFFDPLHLQVLRFVRAALTLQSPHMVDKERFASALKQYYGEATFGDAYARTGRICCISVTVGTSHPRPLLLNYLTTPQVLLWSAVAASCALPGLMLPVTLMARDTGGRTVPYHSVEGVASTDGSMAADLPMEALGQFFHCNRFIVSQTNPHIAPFITKEWDGRDRLDSNVLSSAIWAVEAWLNMDVRSRTKYLAKLKLLPRFFGAEITSIFLQRYSGDVTIVPYHSGGHFSALTQPSEDDLRQYLAEGARATWPHLAHVRALVGIEKCLSRCSRRFLDSGSGGKRAGAGGGGYRWRDTTITGGPVTVPMQLRWMNAGGKGAAAAAAAGAGAFLGGSAQAQQPPPSSSAAAHSQQLPVAQQQQAPSATLLQRSGGGGTGEEGSDEAAATGAASGVRFAHDAHEAAYREAPPSKQSARLPPLPETPAFGQRPSPTQSSPSRVRAVSGAQSTGVSPQQQQQQWLSHGHVASGSRLLLHEWLSALPASAAVSSASPPSTTTAPQRVVSYAVLHQPSRSQYSLPAVEPTQLTQAKQQQLLQRYPSVGDEEEEGPVSTWKGTEDDDDESGVDHTATADTAVGAVGLPLVINARSMTFPSRTTPELSTAAAAAFPSHATPLLDTEACTSPMFTMATLETDTAASAAPHFAHVATSPSRPVSVSPDIQYTRPASQSPSRPVSQRLQQSLTRPVCSDDNGGVGVAPPHQRQTQQPRLPTSTTPSEASMSQEGEGPLVLDRTMIAPALPVTVHRRVSMTPPLDDAALEELEAAGVESAAAAAATGSGGSQTHGFSTKDSGVVTRSQQQSPASIRSVEHAVTTRQHPRATNALPPIVNIALPPSLHQYTLHKVRGGSAPSLSSTGPSPVHRNNGTSNSLNEARPAQQLQQHYVHASADAALLPTVLTAAASTSTPSAATTVMPHVWTAGALRQQPQHQSARSHEPAQQLQLVQQWAGTGEARSPRSSSSSSGNNSASSGRESDAHQRSTLLLPSTLTAARAQLEPDSLSQQRHTAVSSSPTAQTATRVVTSDELISRGNSGGDAVTGVGFLTQSVPPPPPSSSNGSNVQPARLPSPQPTHTRAAEAGAAADVEHESSSAIANQQQQQHGAFHHTLTARLDSLNSDNDAGDNATRIQRAYSPPPEPRIRQRQQDQTLHSQQPRQQQALAQPQPVQQQPEQHAVPSLVTRGGVVFAPVTAALARFIAQQGDGLQQLGNSAQPAAMVSFDSAAGQRCRCPFTPLAAALDDAVTDGGATPPVDEIQLDEATVGPRAAGRRLTGRALYHRGEPPAVSTDDGAQVQHQRSLHEHSSEYALPSAVQPLTPPSSPSQMESQSLERHFLHEGARASDFSHSSSERDVERTEPHL